MLASLLARCSAHGQREVDRYAAWLAAIQRLRDDWESGERPDVRRLRDYLQEIPDSQRTDALQDLISEHLRLSWRAGRGTPLEAYLAEFANEFAGVPAELVEDEFLARYQAPHGDAPSTRECQQRFPARTDVMELLEQRCLDGDRFVRLHKLGLGAFGEVWEAHDHQLRRRVAIKQPRDDLADKAEALRRFAEEARVMAGLEHPGILALREHQPGDGSARFYVMRLVKGQTLGERIRDCHLTPVGQTPRELRLRCKALLRAFAIICDAMAYAHARGILHRDLKPGNVVVDESENAVILDWGMATRVSMSGASPGTVAGTPDYMPPEQADGIADVRSDVFGLGAILYEILTGQSPHGWLDGSRPVDWMRLVRRAEFQAPRQLNAQTPRALEAICMKALARQPDNRYQTAAKLADEVRRYLGGESVSASVEPIWIKAWRWCRSFRRRSTLLREETR